MAHAEEVWSTAARTGERLAHVTDATGTAELDAVVRAAAATAPILAGAGTAGRAALLDAMATELAVDAEPIIASADRETALGETRLRGELARSTFQLRLFAEVLADGGYLEVIIDHADPRAAPAPRPDLRRMLIPLGPVGVFAASNFPLAFSVPGGDTASALAAGCPVVVKAHPGHPYTSELTAAALRRGARRVGLPEELLGLVYGFDAGPDLVRHPLIEAVGFTGSVAGGRALFDLACARPRPIPFFGELGSINPLVVTPAAASERAAQIAADLAGSFTLGNGQFCTKPGLAFVPAGVDGDRLVAALLTAARAVDGGPMLTGSIHDGFVAGARERANLDEVDAALAPAGKIMPHVLLTRAEVASDLLFDECFGPLIVVVRYAGADDLQAALARIPGTLTATIHCALGEDVAGSLAERVARQVAGSAGRVIFNGYPTGVAVTWAMQHGGPYPSSTAVAATSVGATAIRRFLRPVAYQDAPAGLLPAELREDNPLGLPRRVDGHYEPIR